MVRIIKLTQLLQAFQQDPFLLFLNKLQTWSDIIR